MIDENKPHLSASFFRGFGWLDYVGNPKAFYIRHKDSSRVYYKVNPMCSVDSINKITVKAEHLLLTTTLVTIYIPHTARTYDELQNIMEAHCSETV